MGRKSKNQKIEEAVKSLDPENDDHWTEEGLPAMAAVEEIYGDKSITREDVEESIGDYCRGDAMGIIEDQSQIETEVIKKPMSEYEYSRMIRQAVSAYAQDYKHERRTRHGSKYQNKDKNRKVRTYLNG